MFSRVSAFTVEICQGQNEPGRAQKSGSDISALAAQADRIDQMQLTQTI
jgi:hypothetical protein